jgi:hypothetical protein
MKSKNKNFAEMFVRSFVMLRSSLFALIGLVLVGTNAGASTHYPHHHHHARVAAATAHHAHSSPRYAYGGGEVVAHPANCPRTAFCGCGAAQELGLSDRTLWLVRSWYKFPRTAAAPGMAVLWGSRHVAVIRSMHGDGTATVYDANSGGGLTRVHRISLAGLTIVNPHGGDGSALASRSRTPLDRPSVAVRVAYRHRSLTRSAVAGNWPAYRQTRHLDQPEATWREARAEMFVSFVH